LNETEARECAAWTLELGANNLTDAQKQELADLPKIIVKS
jgi:hypothetical protein